MWILAESIDYLFNLYSQDPPIFEAGSSPRRINVTAGQDFTINCRVTESLYHQNHYDSHLTTPGSVTDRCHS